MTDHRRRGFLGRVRPLPATYLRALRFDRDEPVDAPDPPDPSPQLQARISRAIRNRAMDVQLSKLMYVEAG